MVNFVLLYLTRIFVKVKIMVLFYGERKQDILIGIGMRHVGGSTVSREVLFIEMRGVYKGICFIIVHYLFYLIFCLCFIL